MPRWIGGVALALVTLATSSVSGAPPVVHDFGEPGKLPRLYRAPDQRLHLMYVTQKGFRWHVWESGSWTDRGLVPDTQSQGGSKFNNPVILALADGSFHVAWGPPSSWGVTHDVWLQSHDGTSWGAKQTIRPDYTEYLALAPLPGNQIMLIAGIVCPTACTQAFPLAYSTGKAGQSFGAFVDLPIKAPESKTPFVFVQPGSDVFHLVNRWSKLSYRRWDGSSFGPETQLLAGSGYSVGSPVVSATPDGSPVAAGVEWKGSGTNWAIDHVRMVQSAGTGWLPGEEGENVSVVSSEKTAVSADANGGVHLFYFVKAGELSHRFSKAGQSSPAEILATGVTFTGPETDNLAAQYTEHHVHLIAPVDGALRHLAIDTDAKPVSDAGADSGSDAGSGGSGGQTGLDAGGSTTPADEAACSCRVGGSSERLPWSVPLLAIASVLRRIRQRRARLAELERRVRELHG